MARLKKSGSRWESYDATTITPKGGKGIRVTGTTTFAGAVVASGGIQFGGHVTFAPDNTYDIGASGATRPQTLYLGTGVNVGAGATFTSSLLKLFDNSAHLWLCGVSDPRISFGTAGIGDLFLSRKGAASLRLGFTDTTNALCVAQTLTVQGIAAGNANEAGKDFTLDLSQSTGTGVGGSFIIRGTPAGGAGSTQNAYANAMTLTAAGALTIANHVSAAGFGTSGRSEANNFYITSGTVLRQRPGENIGGFSIEDPASGTLTVQFGILARNSLVLGGVPSATPAAQTFTIGESARPGTDTDIGGSSGTIRSGIGTGAGTPSKLILQTPTLGVSGTTAQTMDSAFVCFGGTTSSFPAWKRSGVELHARLADDSAYANIYGSRGVFSADVSANQLGATVNISVNGAQVVGAQGAAVADASGGSTVDAEARTALNTLLARLRTHGLIAT